MADILTATLELDWAVLAAMPGESAQIKIGTQASAPSTAYGNTVQTDLVTSFDFTGFSLGNLMDLRVGTNAVPGLLMGGGEFGLILSGNDVGSYDTFGAGGSLGSLGGQLGSGPTLGVGDQVIYATITMPSGFALSLLTAGLAYVTVRLVDLPSQESF